MSETDNEQMIPTPSDFGHFLLEKELGHGGMGGVYLARDKMLDRKVGIKVMLKALGDDPAFVERFQREAQAAARLNHPNIAQIYSFGTEQGMPYIAMELVSGGSLDKEMEANPGTMDPARVMKVGQQLAEALALAADQGLVHGDVKPENVLFDAEGNAKLVDFGLAAMQGDSEEIWGTPYYISPEKVKRQKIDFRADIYSLGGTLYHALTGVAPFEGEDATAVVKARFDGPPTPPSEVRPDLPKDVDGIIMRMLEMEPSMRYPTYQSLIGDIKRFLAKVGPVRTSRLASGRLKIKGSKLKIKGTAPIASATADVAGGEGEGASAAIPQRLRPLVEETPQKNTNVGAMVGLVAFIVVLLIVGTVGGLFWYVKADKDSKRKAEMAQTVGKIGEARMAVANTLKAASEFASNFHELVAKNDQLMKESTRRMRELLPDDLRAAAKPILEPEESKEIAEAIAYTNKLLSAAGDQPAAAAAKPEAAKPEAAKPAEADKPAEAKPAPKRKAAALSGEEAEEAAAERAMAEQEARLTGKPLPKKEEEKPAEEAKEEAKPAETPAVAAAAAVAASMPLPDAVKKFGALWADVFTCRAADIRVQGHLVKVQRLAAKADDIKGEGFETARALASLSQEVLEAYETMKGLKAVDLAQRKAGIIRANSKSLISNAILQIQNLKAVAEKAARDAKEKAEREAKEEAKRQRMEKAREEEPRTANEKFEELAGSRLKMLDWDAAIKQLKPLAETFISAEGREEIASEVTKVEYMKGLQKHFIKYGRGFKFKDGSTISNVNDKVLYILKLKSVRGHMEPDKVVEVEWTRFYGKKEYVGHMNQLMQALVVNGRDTTKLGPLPWSCHMLGAALTLKYLYAEVPGAAEAAPTYVKKAVKDFEECAKWAKKWFPDVEVETNE